MRVEREIKLSGDEVYRFGAAEFADDEQAGAVVVEMPSHRAPWSVVDLRG
ncbi:hypothetical protein [Saccharothrix hoggarensis]|uniref:Uncharacterized protein n=1 Tax=Saccharothrix hoggarensis TaxID=913853 RepID=A0ABW3QH02_9PSEU